MRPTQDQPGHYWKTDDKAALWFDQAGPEPPQTIRCYNMQDHLNSGEARQVPVNCLEFMAAGIFGGARLCWEDSMTRWTGESYRYGVYCNPSGLYKNGIVILERHGGGLFWLCLR